MTLNESNVVQAQYGILLTHTNILTNGRCSDGTPFRTNRFTETLNKPLVHYLYHPMYTGIYWYVIHGWHRLWNLPKITFIYLLT